MPGKRKRRAVDATGRSKYDRHIRLHHWLLESPAWGSLTPCARAALIVLYSLYHGGNNGELFLSVRTLAERLGVAPNTAQKALADLTERGFIRLKQKGAFSLKVRHATSWILTEFPHGDQLPGKDFMRWQPPVKIKTRYQNLTPTVSKFDTEAPPAGTKNALTVSKFDTDKRRNGHTTVSLADTQIVYHPPTRRCAAGQPQRHPSGWPISSKIVSAEKFGKTAAFAALWR